MENKYEKLIALLKEIKSLEITPEQISDDQLSSILDYVLEVKPLLSGIHTEAVNRLSGGRPVRGYAIHYRQYRYIDDTDKAIQALRNFNPEAASKCTVVKLANITSIKKVIGKAAFETVLAEYTGTRTTVTLVKKPND